MLNVTYKKSRSTEEPKIIDITSTPGKTYLRKNIKVVTENDTVYYEYDEALLTNEEYEEYQAELGGPMITTIMQAMTNMSIKMDEMFLDFEEEEEEEV